MQLFKKIHKIQTFLNHRFISSSHTPRIGFTEAELEAQRHAEGVDAFLTFATEVSSMSSPLKRPASVDSQHSGHHYLMENIPNNYIIESTIYTAASPGATPNSGSGGSAAGSTMSSPTSSSYHSHLHNHNQLQHHHHHHHHSQYLHHHPYATLTATNGYHLSSSPSPSPPKKPRARTLRTKLKKKTVWLRWDHRHTHAIMRRHRIGTQNLRPVIKHAFKTTKWILRHHFYHILLADTKDRGLCLQQPKPTHQYPITKTKTLSFSLCVHTFHNNTITAITQIRQ